MKTRQSLCVCLCLVVASLSCVRMNGQTRQDGPTELEERLTAPLRNAGIAIKEKSLIQALGNQDLLIASRAAALLPRFPKSKRMVKALSATVEDVREIVSVSAARSLLELRETGWVRGAIKRLPEMQDRVAQIQLAGLLAQAGHGEGWPIISSALGDETLGLVALENVSYFDQKPGPDGKPVLVAVEFKNILGAAPDDARQNIERKIVELVADAMNDAREERFAKASALHVFGNQLFPFLEKYFADTNEHVRDLMVSFARIHPSPEGLDILARFLEDRERYIAAEAIHEIHGQYSCAQTATSRYAKGGLKGFLGRTPNSAKAVLLLSCFADDAEVVRLVVEKRKEEGLHGDGGIHSGVPFNLSVEMALAANGDADAVAAVKNYLKEGNVKNLFFILENVKFISSRELRLALVELLNDKRPVYEPIAHTNFFLRVCDLALTALTSTDPTIGTMNHARQRRYTDQELNLAYTELKAKLAKDP